MHPVLRVLCLLMFAAFAARGDVPALVAAWGLMLLLLLFCRGLSMSGVGLMLRRVRWLLLSLFVVYGWMTPGELVIPMFAWASPSFEGLFAGLLRALALAAMVMAVTILLKTTDRPQLLTAIYQLSWPLACLGLPMERFAARLVLVMDAVPQVQDLVKRNLQSRATESSIQDQAAAVTSAVYSSVLEAADQQSPGLVDYPQPVPVPLIQWLYPVSLAMVFVMAAQFFP